MRLAIVGAGALGRVYGVRLAVRAGASVAFVVRPARLAETTPFVIEMAARPHERDALAAPERVDRVPADAEAVLLAVHASQIDAPLADRLAAGPTVPVVSLTPLFPAEHDALAAKLDGRLVAAQSGVVAYDEGGTIRYWVPRSAPTLVDADAQSPVLDALVAALVRAGLPAHRAPGVATSNPATSIEFLPLILGVHAAGSVRGVLDDRALFGDVLAAFKEARALASRIGKPAGFADLLAKFIGPVALRVGVGVAERSSPEAVRFVETHFAHKVRGQNLQMGREARELFRRHGLASPAFERVLAAAEARG